MISPLSTPKPLSRMGDKNNIKIKTEVEGDTDNEDEFNETIKPGMDFSSPNASTTFNSTDTPCKAKRNLINPNGPRTPTPFKNALAEVGKRRGEM